MRADIERWERRYCARDPHARVSPDEWLAQSVAGLPRGPALDVACGAGANAVFLARSGFEVIGLDGSVQGLRLARDAARAAGTRLALAALDLEGWLPPVDRFALVTMLRFLDRQLLERLVPALRPGGYLALKTFNVNRLASAPDFNPDYLLRPGELARRLTGLELVELDDGETGSHTSRVLARRPAR